MYSCPTDWTDTEATAECAKRWPAPHPALSTVRQWRDAGARKRDEFRHRVWAEEWAKSAQYLVPLCLNSLKDTLLIQRKALQRADERNDDKAIASLSKALTGTAGELLSHLGAPTSDTAPNPDEVRRLAIEGLVLSSGGEIKLADAERMFDALSQGAASLALRAGETPE